MPTPKRKNAPNQGDGGEPQSAQTTGTPIVSKRRQNGRTTETSGGTGDLPPSVFANIPSDWLGFGNREAMIYARDLGSIVTLCRRGTDFDRIGQGTETMGGKTGGDLRGLDQIQSQTQQPQAGQQPAKRKRNISPESRVRMQQGAKRAHANRAAAAA